jgi:hypothetical protein
MARFSEERAAYRHRRSRHPLSTPAKANAIAEQVIEPLRRECLDHLIVFDEQHYRTVLTEFVQHYNQERPHGTFGLQTSQPKVGPAPGIVRSRSVLNGYTTSTNGPCDLAGRCPAAEQRH